MEQEWYNIWQDIAECDRLKLFITDTVNGQEQTIASDEVNAKVKVSNCVVTAEISVSFQSYDDRVNKVMRAVRNSRDSAINEKIQQFVHWTKQEGKCVAKMGNEAKQIYSLKVHCLRAKCFVECFQCPESNNIALQIEVGHVTRAVCVMALLSSLFNLASKGSWSCSASVSSKICSIADF
jgi:hypothetical protein